ncbi:MAG: hypothetical protein ACOVRN_00685 [Flavobacterium sp.]
MDPATYKTKIDSLIIAGYNDRYRNVAYLTPNELANKPLTTTMDAREEDLKTILDQQKILLAVATVTATTFLISAIFLAND